LLTRLRHLEPWQRNLWSIVLVEILVIMAFQTGAVLIPYYIQELGVRDLDRVGVWTGAYQSMGSISFAIFTPIWGAVGDRYGRKLMLVRAMAGTALALGLNGLVRTPMQLVLLRIVQGAFSGTPAAASAVLAAGSPRHRLAYSLGLLQTALFIGSSLGPMLGGYIGDIYGYRSAFYVAAVVTLVATALVIILIHEPERPESAMVAAQPKRPSMLGGFGELLAIRTFMLLTVATFLGNLTFGLLSPVLPLFVQQIAPDPRRLASIAGAITGAMAFTSAISALIVGRMSDRLGNRRALVGCSLGTTLCYFPQAIARSTLSLGLWRALQGFFRGGVNPTLSALVVRSAPDDCAGAALGLNSSASSIGFAIGPMLGAMLMARTSFGGVFVIAGLGSLLVILAVMLTPRDVAYNQEAVPIPGTASE
jgi:MFS transporter, DHA1 family, multidrug resistance protein